MGRFTNIETMPIEEIRADCTQEQRELSSMFKIGKTDPVFFAENILKN